MCRRLCRLLRGDDAATAVEYAVMLALVLLAVFAAIITLGQNTNQSWSNSNNSLKAVNFGS
jgi:pilus assembly protein Flp/PilA